MTVEVVNPSKASTSQSCAGKPRPWPMLTVHHEAIVGRPGNRRAGAEQLPEWNVAGARNVAAPVFGARPHVENRGRGACNNQREQVRHGGRRDAILPLAATAIQDGNNPRANDEEGVMESVAMRIGGRDAGSADGRYFEKRNPFAGGLTRRVPDAGPLDAVAAAEAAAAAFAAWSGTPPSRRRGDSCWKAADLLEQRAPDIAKTITAETAATLGWGMFNTAFAATMMREAAAATTQITGETIPSDIPGNIALSVHQPVGVVLSIAPWNAPMILGVRAVAMPLACGNTVVLKASEECPQTHRIIGDVLEDAGLPAGAINVLTTSREGAGATVDALIADPRIRRINFTGSTEVGRTIAQKAATHLETRSF